MEDCSTDDPAATGNALWPTVDRRVRVTSRDVDEAERSRRLDQRWVIENLIVIN